MDVAPSSIWLRPERSTRGPAPEHSRARLARAGVELADRSGLTAVTMRSVAAAVGTAPASLYRYVATRDELVELMADQVNGEFTYSDIGSGSWLDQLLALAHQGRDIYLRHPWLLEVAPNGAPLGPHALTYLEQVLGALSGVDVSGQTKLEAVGVYSGVVRLLSGTEVAQRRAGEAAEHWQSALEQQLTQVIAGGRHPHLAAALSTPSATTPDARTEPAGAGAMPALFDRVLTRVLTGLLQPPGHAARP